jgi:predicted nucleic acid-binding protein
MLMAKSSQGAAHPAPLVVLDTNVVLDWLVFGDADVAALRAAIACGAVQWSATAAMRAEAEQVLARQPFEAWQPDLPTVWHTWDRHCLQVAVPPPASATVAARLHCTDPDDQKFIDLAVACGARWLLTRDRAVLELASRLREHGVEVATPRHWSALTSAD